MMTLTQLIVFSLATWRVASLLVAEDGPFRVFQNFRKRLGIQHTESGEPYGYPEKFLPQLLSCVWCTSIWVGFGWLSFFLISPDWATKFAAAFSFSTAAIMIDKWIKG